jgi:hypothetical protein
MELQHVFVELRNQVADIAKQIRWVLAGMVVLMILVLVFELLTRGR